MRVLDRRLRRLEVGLLPAPETEESRRFVEMLRGRPARIGLVLPEYSDSVLRPGMSIAEKILAARRCVRERQAAEA